MSDEELELYKRSPLDFIRMLIERGLKPVDLKPRVKIERPDDRPDWFAEAYAKAHQDSGWKLTFAPWASTEMGATKATLQFIDEPSENE